LKVPSAGGTNRNISMQNTITAFYLKHQQPELSQTQGWSGHNTAIIWRWEWVNHNREPPQCSCRMEGSWHGNNPTKHL